jgi:hypothetical protein
MYPSLYVSSYKHAYNSTLEEYLNDVIVNSLSIYMDREDFIDSVNDTDENIKIAETLVSYFYEKGVIVLNQKYICIDDKKSYVEKLNFDSIESIQKVISEHLKDRGNLFILYTVTYSKSKKEYIVMGKYLSNTGKYNEQFIKDYIKTKRVYLINKLLDITNDDPD